MMVEVTAANDRVQRNSGCGSLFLREPRTQRVFERRKKVRLVVRPNPLTSLEDSLRARLSDWQTDPLRIPRLLRTPHHRK